MRTTPKFQVGERVRARSFTYSIRAGMEGTVLAVFLPTNMMYSVQFDDLPQLEVVREELLEQAVARVDLLI